MSKEYKVKDLIEELQKFDENATVIVKGTKNGTYSHTIQEIYLGKHRHAQGKVCIEGRPW